MLLKGSHINYTVRAVFAETRNLLVPSFNRRGLLQIDYIIVSGSYLLGTSINYPFLAV